MKKYCFDTSGFSNPLESMPEDIHDSFWQQVMKRVEDGAIAVTAEIYEEMCHIPGNLGTCIKDNKSKLLLEVGEGDWDWQTYIAEAKRMQTDYRQFISEYNGGSKRTVGLNDLSIVALGKTLKIPVVSMERLLVEGNKRRIPNICQMDRVTHHDFHEFCRLEKIKA